MQKVFLYVGIPGSGKSTAAKLEINKDPENWARINNDDIRAMLNNSNWSFHYEKLVTDTRNYLIREALRRGKDVIIDNLNINRKHFTDVVEIAKTVNRDIQVLEKAFYVELDEAIERDSKREGKAKVGEEVIKKWWKESGGKQFKFFKPRVEVLLKNFNTSSFGEKPLHNPNVPNAIMCDLDGTVSLFNKVGDSDDSAEVMYPGAHFRNPYDASTCDQDMLNEAVAAVIRQFHSSGTKIIFCSGRKDDYKLQTLAFLNRHFSEIKFDLFMRKTEDNRKDSIIKEEIYHNNIEGKYNITFVLDDRGTVVETWRKIGLTCFQVAPGNF